MTIATQSTPSRLIRLSTIIARIARRFDAIQASAWLRGLGRYRSGLDLRRLENALAGGHWREVEAAMDVQRLEMTLEKAMREAIRATAVQGGTAAIRGLEGAGYAASFNAIHPNVVLYAHDRAARLVTGISAQTRAEIRLVLTLGATGQATVTQQARLLRNVVGLPANWLGAPLRLADELRAGNPAAAGRRFSATERQQIRSRINAGTSGDPTFVEHMTGVYSERLLNLRAAVIARTESIAASNWGVWEAWKQAQDEGVLPATARQYWLATPDSRLCEICAAIPGLNADGRLVEEPFDTALGPVQYPPAHPQCRCSLGILP